MEKQLDYNSGKVCTTFAKNNKEGEMDLITILKNLEIYNLPNYLLLCFVY